VKKPKRAADYQGEVMVDADGVKDVGGVVGPTQRLELFLEARIMNGFD
jgi:hypothetical protein